MEKKGERSGPRNAKAREGQDVATICCLPSFACKERCVPKRNGESEALQRDSHISMERKANEKIPYSYGETIIGRKKVGAIARVEAPPERTQVKQGDLQTCTSTWV